MCEDGGGTGVSARTREASRAWGPRAVSLPWPGARPGGAGRVGGATAAPPPAGGRCLTAGGLAVPRRGRPAWIAQSRGAGPRNAGGGRMNSIKNVPARVLSRRPGHSLEAEREQFDKTQASGGAAGGRRAGGAVPPSPHTRPSGPGLRPPPERRELGPLPGPLAPRPSGGPRPHLGRGHPAPRPSPPEPTRAQVNRKREPAPGPEVAGDRVGRGLGCSRGLRCDQGTRWPGDRGVQGLRGGREPRWLGAEGREGPGGGSRDAAGGQVGSRCVPAWVRPAGAARLDFSALAAPPLPGSVYFSHGLKECPLLGEAMHFLKGNSLLPFLLSCFSGPHNILLSAGRKVSRL